MDGIVSQPAPALSARDIVGALDWWRDAGVDLDFGDSPANWLPPEPGEAPASPFAAIPGLPGLAENTATQRTGGANVASPAEIAPIGGDPALWPTDLASFQAWWLTDPSLDDGAVRQRIAPRGPHGARIMVIVPQPEAGDEDHLLAGQEGRLLDTILAAMGVPADAAYVAAALPRHTPMADWASLAARDLGRLIAHHIALVAPERIIMLGSNILPLPGHDPAQNAQNLRSFNHEGRTTPLLAGRELGALIARPAWKAGFWRDWLEWTGSETE